jgi:hypothetical protein
MKDFKVGDRVIYTYNGDDDTHQGKKKAIFGTTGKVIRLHSDGRIGVEFDKRFDFMHECGGLGRQYHCYNVSPDCIRLIDNEEMKRRKIKKELNRMKYQDIDPYGEDDWEDGIFESIDYFFKEGDNIKVKDDYNLEDYKGKKGKIIKIDGDLVQVRFEDEKTKLFYETDIVLNNKSEITKRKRLKTKTEKEMEEDRIEKEKNEKEKPKKEKLVKESAKPKFIDLNDFIDKCAYNIAVVENELQELLIGEEVIFYTMTDILKKTVVSSVQVDEKRGNFHIFFNNFSVNKEFSIEIVKEEKPHIVGLPTGEVIFVSNAQLKKLKSEGLVNYQVDMYWGDNHFKDINYFADTNYHKVRLSLDKNYKKKTNVEKQSDYKQGDYVVCQGMSQNLNVEGQVAQIEGNVMTKNGRMYLVSFMFRFNDMLHNGDGGTGNKWWVFGGNIKGIYTGDIDLHLGLSNKMRRELEDHEIDDDYHIKNLFKGE